MGESRVILILSFLLFGQCSFAQNIHWQQRLGSFDPSFGAGFGYEAPADVRFLQDGSIAIGGVTQGSIGFQAVYSNVGPDTILSPEFVHTIPFVARFDFDGELIWNHYILASDSNFNSGNARTVFIDLDSLDNIYACFRVYGDVTVGPTNYTNLPEGSHIVVKIDSSGNFLWQKRFTPAYEDESILEGVSDGNSLYITGRYRDTLSFEDSIILENDLPWASRDLYYLKLSSSGNIEQLVTINQAFGGMNGGREQPIGFDVDQSGNVYWLITLDSAIVDGDTLPEVPGGSDEGKNWVIKYNSSGSVVWKKEFYADGSENTGHPERCLAVGDDGIFIAMNSAHDGSIYYDSVFVDSINNRGEFIFKLSLNGDLIKHFFPSVTGNINSYPTFTDMLYRDGVMYCSGIASNTWSIHNMSDTAQSGLYHAYLLAYDNSTDSFYLPVRTSQYATSFSRAHAIDVDTAGNILFAGTYGFPGISIEGETLSVSGTNTNSQDIFLSYHLSCDYLKPTIPDSTKLICQGEGVDLAINTNFPNLNYQWLFSGGEILGANDSIYSALVPGSYSVEISDSVCRKRVGPIVVQDGSPEQVNLSIAQTAFCASDPSYALTGGSPAGGYYAGQGVSNGQFSPQAAGAGTFTIYYVYNQSSGCVDSAEAVINVFNSPSAFFFQSFTSACSGDSIILNSGIPSGGQYSGVGVSGNVFSPTLQDTGDVWLYYTQTNGTCSSTDSISVEVHASPTVSLNLPLDSVCESSGAISLSGNSPSGGVFSGTGVSGSFFIPAIVQPGNLYQIDYSLTENSCTTTASDYIFVDSFPSVTLPSLDSICLSATALQLDHGSPAGGYYFGSGISNNTFDATVPGLGTSNVGYVFDNSCGIDSATSTIQVISSPTISASITPVSCYGGNDGAITATTSGGNNPFQFTWSNGDSTNSPSQLIAGNYTVTVNGEGGCFATQTVNLTQPTDLLVSLDSVSDVVCNGFSNGEAFISTTGGTGPYTFSWSNSETTEDATALQAGSSTLVVTDNNGCQDSLSVTINELSPVVLSSVVDSLSCYDDTNGSIQVSASGAGGTYSYAWSNGSSSSTISNLDSGNYSITVTDQNSCSAIDSFELSTPDSLTIAFQTYDVSCFGGNDGSVKAFVSGGVSPYAYAWSNSSMNDSIGTLSAATYTLAVTDAKGCMKISSATVEQPDSLSINASLVQSNDCFGDSTAELFVVASGGNMPYGYAWSNGESQALIDSLPAGTYTLTLTDTNNCQKTQSVVVDQPDEIVITLDSFADASCFNYNDGYLATSFSGGTGVYGVIWNTGSSQSMISGLDSGQYSITVFDQNSCTAFDTFNLSQPTQIGLQVTGSDLLCFNDSSGQATAVTLNGQGAFTYAWSNGQNGASISSLPAGVYTITATDTAACFRIDSIELEQPQPLSLSATIDQNLCFGDTGASIALSMSGGTTPFAYAWSTGATSDSIDSLTNGSYAVTVTDSNNCLLDSTFTINDPLPLILSVDSISDPLCFGDSTGHIAIDVTGGTPSYQFNWSNGPTQAINTLISSGTYLVTVSDTNGCLVDSSLTLTDPPELLVSLDSINALLGCFGDTSGFISTSITGGTGTLAYGWSNGDTSLLITGLSAGNYTLTVTDEQSCHAEFLANIDEPDSLQIQASIEDATCDNLADGSIGITAGGGTLPYAFDWNGGQSTSNLDSIAHGTYVLTLTDSNGCMKTANYMVSYTDSAPLVNLGADTGFCEGTWIQLDAGEDAVSYLWSTGDTNQFLTIAEAGSYYVQGYSLSGCLTSDSINIEEHPYPMVDLGSDTVLCQPQLENGLLLTGPTGLSQYQWSSGGTGSSETVFSFGTYWLEGTNEFGCSSIDSIEIINDTCVGLDDYRVSLNWKVYPNPTRDVLHIEHSGNPVKGFEVKLYNNLGQAVMVQNSEVNYLILELANIPAGIYLVSMRQLDGDISAQRMVIVN